MDLKIGNEKSLKFAMLSMGAFSLKALYCDYEYLQTEITYLSTSTNSFSYNAFGARVSKTDSSGTSTYARNGVSVVAPVLTDGTLTYTPSISSCDGTSSTWSHGDIKNSLRQTAENETTSATKHYDAFGNETTSTGTWQGPFQYGGAFGYQTDSDSGLKLLGHRYYDSSTGRFLSRDIAKDGGNWYQYCRNNPARFVDSSGLAPSIAGLRPPWLDGKPALRSSRGLVLHPNEVLMIILQSIPDGIMTGLAAIGSSATLGFWDGGGSKHKPGFGVSKVLAYIGLSAALLAGGAAVVVGRGITIVIGRLLVGIWRYPNAGGIGLVAKWRGLEGFSRLFANDFHKWGTAPVWAWLHGHIGTSGNHLPWQVPWVSRLFKGRF
jgi:RHS repeat-associated protein